MRLLNLFSEESISKAELLAKRSKLDAEMRLLEKERAAVAMNNNNIFDQLPETRGNWHHGNLILSPKNK